jgi:effector-binding domain-containing protein
MTSIGAPKIDERPPLAYMGIRKVVPFKGLSREVDALNRELHSWVNENQVHTAGPPFLRYHVIDMRGFMDICYAVPVDQTLAGNGRVEPGELLSGRYASLVYSGGGISGNRALIEWVRSQGLDFDRWDSPEGDNFRSRYERFLTDPKVEPRKSRWQIEVAIMLAETL